MPVGNNATAIKPGSRLREFGLVLPKPPSPLGAYVESSQAGSLLFVSGTLPLVDGKLAISGRLGANLSVNQVDGYEESKVFVKVTKEAILEAPEYHVPPLGAT